MVIVIIGILAAVAAVSYNSFIGNANDTAAEATATQVAKILQADSAFQQAAITDGFVVSDTAVADFPANATVGGLDASNVVTVANLDVTYDGTTCTLTPGATAGSSVAVAC